MSYGRFCDEKSTVIRELIPYLSQKLFAAITVLPYTRPDSAVFNKLAIRTGWDPSTQTQAVPLHEIQRHTFHLKSKDRQVPAMPLAYYSKQGKLTRYNLRKFAELPFQLVRCFCYKDLYNNVLFNYQWLYHKMCALPLPEVLCDFEDAAKNIHH